MTKKTVGSSEPPNIKQKHFEWCNMIVTNVFCIYTELAKSEADGLVILVA
jgi:hypothetical protein